MEIIVLMKQKIANLKRELRDSQAALDILIKTISSLCKTRMNTI